MQYNTAHAAYSQNAVGGIESPTKLIEMLYEGVLRFVFRAKKAMQENDVEKKPKRGRKRHKAATRSLERNDRTSRCGWMS